MELGGFRQQVYSLLLIGGVLSSIGIPAPLARKGLPARPPAVAVAGSMPQACISYNPSRNEWGEEFHTCAPGYASYGVADSGGKERDGSMIPAVQYCCPVPSPDILTKEEIYVEKICPENYVATGSKLDFSKGEFTIQYMRCTKINSARYKLGDTHGALYFGNGFAGWQASERIDREDIPAGLRFGIGRNSKDRWAEEGCVGYPYGSMLTEKHSKYCGGFLFRELQFTGLPGDPPAGTPVKMFADCNQVDRLDDPNNPLCRS